MKTSKVTALVLAAGYSSRMAQFKPLLDLGGKPVVARVVDSLNLAGIQDVRVVIGHKKSVLKPLLNKMGAKTVENDRYDDGMFSSVKAGINSLEPGIEAFFVLPADVPMVRPWTLRRLADSFVPDEDRIVAPCYHGKKGHPLLIGTCVKEQIISYTGSGGLRGFLKQYEDEVRMLPVPDENIGFDVDVPADYIKLLHRWKRKDIPSIAECEVILNDILKVDQAVLLHSRAVAVIAGRIAAELTRSGNNLDQDLVIAAALLHDISRGRPDHANESAAILSDMGYNDVAEVVRWHMDIVYSPKKSVGAAEVLYLADKLVIEDKPVPLSQRFEKSFSKYGEAADIRRQIENRYLNALQIKQSIEAITGALKFETASAVSII